MLAQATDAIWPGLSTLINLGFSGVVAWYLLTKALPKIQDAYLAEIKEMRTHSDTREEKAATEHKKALDVVLEHCEKENVRHDEAKKVEMAIMTKAMEDNGLVMEQTRTVLSSVVSALATLSKA